MDMNLVQDFFEFMLQLAFWYFVFSVISAVISNHYQTKMELYKNTVDDIRQRIHLVKQEKYGDMHYWFDMETNTFIAQGLTFDEIAAKLKAQFMDHVFITEKFSLEGPDFVPKPLSKEMVDNWPKSSV
jgi:hypothetical protein